VLSIHTEGIIDPSLIHVLYGMSKDFGGNGLRCGVILSQNNPSLLQAAGSISLFSEASHLTQLAACAILEDQKFLDWYIPENQRRLGEAYVKLTDWCKKWEIPHVEGNNAGFFLWCNFRRFIPALSSPDRVNLEFTETELREGNKDGAAVTYPELDVNAKEAEDEFSAKLDKNKVFLGSASNFFGERHGWYRITFSLPQDTLLLGLSRVESVLEEYLAAGTSVKENEKPLTQEIAGSVAPGVL
jgi:aspartate/methionine/tyrosine aminotransferase